MVSGKKEIPLLKVHVPPKAVEAFERVISSGFINEGVQVAEFEKKLSGKIGNKLTCATNSCTGALTLALKIAGVGPGDEVVSSPMTCVATNTPIKNLFAKPVWCDIDSDVGNIDPDKIEENITEKTKAILFVDWIGIPADLDRVKAIGEKHNIKVIEDSAHAFGAVYKGKKVGTVSDFTCFSFQAIKHITTGDGGAITFLDENDYKRGRTLKWFGIDREQTRDTSGNWKGMRWDCAIPEAGYKFHMNNLAASLGLEQLELSDSIVNNHVSNADYYMEELKDVPGISLPAIREDVKPSWWVFMIFVEKRDELAKKLLGRGISSSLLHVRNDIYECFEESKAELPNVTKFQEKELCIPCGWWVSEEDREYIVKIIKEGW